MKLPEIQFYDAGKWISDKYRGQTPVRVTQEYELEYHRVEWGQSMVNGELYTVDADTFTFNVPGDVRSTIPPVNKPLITEFVLFRITRDESKVLTSALRRMPHAIKATDTMRQYWEQLRLMDWKSKNPVEAMQATVVLFALLLEMTGGSHSVADRADAARAERRMEQSIILQRTVSFMENNLGRNCSIEEIAAVTGYSPSHFTRLFRKVMNHTPHWYYRELHIREAEVQLVLYPNKKVTDIAIDLGFSGSGEFGQVFRKHRGMTPREFRQRYTVDMIVNERKQHAHDGLHLDNIESDE